jgi:hypothetical protein
MARDHLLVPATAVAALAAVAVAAVAWTRPPTLVERPAPSIRIVDVRPLRSPTVELRDLITHTFAVRVAIVGWKLLPYRPGAAARDNRPGAGHWRLYLDGFSLGDNLGSSTVSYTTRLTPGTHWIAAELSNADSTSLRPAIWSEPAILHVPRVLRCWQNGWRGTPETGTPTFRCHARRALRPRPSSGSLVAPRKEGS